MASKLTDLANKPSRSRNESCVAVGLYFPNIEQWHWYDQGFEGFIDDLEKKPLSNTLRHKNEYYSTHIKSKRSVTEVNSTPPILMTKEVFLGFKRQCPDDSIVKDNLISKKSVKVPEHGGDVYGGDVIFAVFRD